jgi:hypothetical protein
MTLLLIKRIHHHTPVAKVDFAVWRLLPGEGMFHPVFVVSLRIYSLSVLFSTRIEGCTYSLL